MSAPDPFTAEKLAWLEQVQDDQEISATGFAVAFGVARHLNRKTRDAWPRQALLGEHAGVSARQVRTLLKLLRERGHLAIEPGGFHRPDRYRLTLRVRKSNSGHDRKPTSRETGSKLPPNPLREPYERIVALSPDDEIEADRIFSSLPKACASRSNRALVRGAVASLISEGLQAKALRIAVAAFVSTSPDAIDKGGRFMGPAHTWLTNKRGWEAFAPSADDLFLDGRPNGDNEWLCRVRLWQRVPDAWRHKRAEWGPEPDHEGSRVPSEILTHCEVAPAGLECGPVDRQV